MTTRYTAQPETHFGVPGLSTGYQGKSASDLTIPSVGLEDVDKSLFDLFNEGIPFTVGGGETETKRVPVIFAAGEKWALNKRMRALRDRNGSLILPLMTIVRSLVTQSASEDIAGRGINQQTGEIVIHRRLDKTDRVYQNLVNRLLLQHQQNLAVDVAHADVGQLTTVRAIGDMSSDPIVRQGGLLLPNRKNNIWETIVIPSPQFFTAQYDVTVWTQYTTHMNQVLEQLMSSFLPQGNCWRLDTAKGYWFIASVDTNTYTPDTNTDDFSQAERVLKYKFTIKVPGYVLASQVPGAPVPVKRYVSSPSVSFSVDVGGPGGPSSVTEPYLGADDPTLPLDTGDDAPSRRDDQRRVNGTRLYPNVADVNPGDPALVGMPRGAPKQQFQKMTSVDRAGNTVTRLLRVKSTNPMTGETVLSAADMTLGGVTIIVGGDG